MDDVKLTGYLWAQELARNSRQLTFREDNVLQSFAAINDCLATSEFAIFFQFQVGSGCNQYPILIIQGRVIGRLWKIHKDIGSIGNKIRRRRNADGDWSTGTKYIMASKNYVQIPAIFVRCFKIVWFINRRAIEIVHNAGDNTRADYGKYYDIRQTACFTTHGGLELVWAP